MTLQASLAEPTIAQYSSSRRLSCTPGMMPAELLSSPSPSRQSFWAVTVSFRDTSPRSTASSASSTVMTLVRLAGARCCSAFRA